MGRASPGWIRGDGGDKALLEGKAAPVTLVSCGYHRVGRVVASASAAGAMCLSEAVAQSDWMRALWREVELGPRRVNEKTKKRFSPHVSHRFERSLRSSSRRDSGTQ